MVDDLVKILYLPTPLDEKDEQGKALINDIFNGWYEKYGVLSSDSIKKRIFEYLSNHDKCVVTWRYRGSYPLEFSFENPLDAKYTHEDDKKYPGNPIIMGVIYLENLEK